MPEYRLTTKAESDLVDIARYTKREWGAKQRDEYIHQLFELFDQITNLPKAGRKRDDIRPGLRSRQHKKTHTVFYRMIKEDVEILRILHSRCDVLQVSEEDY